jgi:3-oxoacyl-[acyl-carrier-protein] synthase II
LRARILAGGDRGGAGDLPLGEVDFAALLGGRGLRHMSRGTLALLAASGLALRDAGLADETARDADATGVTAGSATATAGLVAAFDRTTLAEGPQAVNPAIFPQTVWNGASSQVAIRFGLRGANLTVSTGLNSGVEAVLAGVRLIRGDRARVVLAGGFEEITPFFRVLFAREGGGADIRLSEGAAVLVLERRSAAAARGVSPLAAIRAGRSAFAPIPGSSGARLRSLVGEVLRAGDGAAPARTWCLGAGAAAAADGVAVDLDAVAGCGGGLSGALAAALAAAGAVSPELVAATDGTARVAALLLGPAA